MTISICISSYGSEEWSALAISRALPSAEMQAKSKHEIILNHEPEGTISSCRNGAAGQATGDWLCFLDADDQLARNYCHSMLRSMKHLPRDGSRRIYTPKVSYIKHGRLLPARFWPEVPLQTANWLVLGTLIERDFFFSLGGFHDYGDPPGSNAFEDWALWARCWKAGVEIVKVPRAIYLAHWSEQSRHHAADHTTRLGWHYEIGSDLFPESYPPGWANIHRGPPARRTRRERPVRRRT